MLTIINYDWVHLFHKGIGLIISDLIRFGDFQQVLILNVDNEFIEYTWEIVDIGR